MVFTLEDYLVQLHSGQWFGFKGEHVYSNLVIHSSDDKPSESSCVAGVAALQLSWDNKDYARKRRDKYNALNQDEMRYDDVKNSTTTWIDAIDSIKAAHPKP
jgi:hypothetical protein